MLFLNIIDRNRLDWHWMIGYSYAVQYVILLNMTTVLYGRVRYARNGLDGLAAQLSSQRRRLITVYYNSQQLL